MWPQRLQSLTRCEGCTVHDSVLGMEVPFLVICVARPGVTTTAFFLTTGVDPKFCAATNETCEYHRLRCAVFSGQFHMRRKVDNSFLGQGVVFRHCPRCRSLSLRLWLTRRPYVRRLLRATRARFVPVLCRSGVRSGLSLRACRAQSADDYAHTRTGPASPEPLAHGRSPAAVAERS